MFRSIYEIREFVLNLLQKGSTGTRFWYVMHFQIILSLLQAIIDWLFVRDIVEKSLNRFVTAAYLKKQPLELLCRKRCYRKSYRKALVLEPLFNKVEGLRVCNTWCFPPKFAKFLRTLSFKNTCIFM